MNDRVPCGASAAELAHDRASCARRPSAHYLERATDDLVERALTDEHAIFERLDEETAMRNLAALFAARNRCASRDEIILLLAEQADAFELRLRADLEGSERVMERAQELAAAAREDGDAEARFADPDVPDTSDLDMVQP